MQRLAHDSMARAAMGLLTAVVLVGCATNKAKTPVLSSSFYGVWTNVNPNVFNWWVISAIGAVNYGIALNQGKCGGQSAVVLGPNQIYAPPLGSADTAHLRLSESGFLVFEGAHGRALHKRVAPTDICRKSDGTYFDGAPHVAAIP
jgi:hypothetical protein